jgi:glyoxylase-like metal-dependent hydrolase (beta-lactamase superfamily II)
MVQPVQVCNDVFMVGGSALSHSYDCAVYLIDAGELVLVDTGAGLGFDTIISNIKALDYNPQDIKSVIVTHAHIDHIGSLSMFQEIYGTQVIAHKLDTVAIEQGINTGAEAYGVEYRPCTVDLIITEPQMILNFTRYELVLIHIPGHTPGSIAVYLDVEGNRVLFGQDIHGPYIPEWGADRVKAKQSLQKLIDLNADILCEGHFGVYTPADNVKQYINTYLNSL